MNAPRLRTTVFALSATIALAAHAGTVDMADVPLGSSIDPAVKPNIMFILDKSGSMAWTHLPDVPLGPWNTSTGSASQGTGNGLSQKYGYASAQCNPVYFDPTITYTPPVKADGTSYPPATFTAAWKDGFKTSSGTVNLSTQFQAYTKATSYDNWDDALQAAYYYQYSGTVPYSASTAGHHFELTLQSGVYVPVTSTQYYKECASSIGTTPGSGVFTKVNVATASTAVRQNFANWYSYYRTRINTVKTVLGLSMWQLNNPNSLRLGLVYHDYWSGGSGAQFIPISDYSDTTGVVNATSSCSSASTQRAKLYCALYAASAANGTPTRTALSMVGRIYANSAGSGYTDPVQYKCQRNSAILVTDGFWNTDSCGQNMTGGCVGDQDATLARPFYEGPTATKDSMADIAAYYYNTHIRSALDTPPPPAAELPIAACPQVAKQGWVRQTAADCATYVHMNTFTMGLGASGVLNYVWGYQTPHTSADFDSVSGQSWATTPYLNWPDPTPNENITRVDDLWHAAVNGHGLYFSASNPNTIANGLKQAFAAAAETGGGGGGAPTEKTINTGDFHFKADYTTDEWSGDLAAYPIDPKTGVVSATQAWSAQAPLDARTGANSDTRTIWMAGGGGLVSFNAANLTADIANHWFDAGPTNPNGQLEQYQFYSAAQITAATPASIIAFIRGQRGLEDPANDTTSTNVSNLYRGRKHVLGDIVDSSPAYALAPAFDYQDPGYQSFKNLYAGRAGAVYIGANDGMLHAFNATSGAELWAFVPTAVLPYLYKLADKNYNVKHRYFVDGWITVGDVDFGNSNWHTVLIGGLGKGGRAYYALDVTNPNSPSLLWEFASSASATATGTYDPNLGYTPDGAQMTKVKGGAYDGKWVAAFASGYNNTSPGDGQARLYVVDVKTGANLEEIVTGGGNDPLTSGIGWIQAWTDSGMTNNLSNNVYAGDLGGRIWRFDMAAKTATPLTTLGSSSVTQPVTSRVELGKYQGDVNQRVVYVGTGRYLGYCDIDPTAYPTTCPTTSSYYPINAVQSLYAIRDTGNALKNNVGNPYFRSVAIPLATGDRNSTITYNNVTTNSYGWYMDFTAQPGERVTLQPQLDLLTQSTLTVVTNVPAADKCDVGGTSYLYTLESQPAKAHVAPNNTVIALGSALAEGFSIQYLPNGAPVVVVTKSDATTVTITGTPQVLGSNVRRISWRELKN